MSAQHGNGSGADHRKHRHDRSLASGGCGRPGKCCQPGRWAGDGRFVEGRYVKSKPKNNK